MLAKWIEEYKRIIQRTRIFSQLGTFLVSIFAFLSFGYIINAISYTPNALNDFWNELLVSISFHLIIGIFFMMRFVSLFFDSKKSFWFSQVIWVICISLIAAYYIATRYAIYGSFYPPKSSVSFGMDDYSIIFLHGQYSFVFFTSIYFFTSPIRQLITAIIALIKSR